MRAGKEPVINVLNTLLAGEFRQQRRRLQYERHKFPDLTMKNIYSFAHLRRAFFILGHLADAFVLSTT